MLYYEPDNVKSRKIGIAAALLYIILWLAVMLLVSFKFEVNEAGEGILISFGDVEAAAGEGQHDMGLTIPESSNVPMTNEGEMLTQDLEDAPAIFEDQGVPKKPTPEREQPAQTKPVPERTADPKLSFPGVTPTQASSSSGTAAVGVGHQGRADGSPLGDPDGTGQGNEGVGFDLAGRRVQGALPPPTYKEGDEGTVVIEVVVRADGTVKSARRVSSNRDSKTPSKRNYTTTINDSRLIREAERVAMRSRFDKIADDTEQIGWLIYTFNIK